MDRLFNIIRNQFIDVIEWTDDSRDTLSFRWPDEDREIKNGAQLIVRESQLVQFVAAGQFADLFGPGKYTLTTENIPILSTILGWKYGFQSPFKCDVYYLNTRLFTGNKWGTANPVMMRDPDFGVVRLRAFGTYDFRIVDAPRFLKEVAGRYAEMGEALLPVINPAVREKYGLEISSFVLENVSVPPEVEQAIDKQGSMRAIGNLNDYVKYQMGLGMGQGGDGGAGAAPAQMAMGFAMAQEMMRGMQGSMAPADGLGTQAAGGAGQGMSGGTPSGQGTARVEEQGPNAVPGRGDATGTFSGAAVAGEVAGLDGLTVLTPGQAAALLSVPEEDVMASIQAGDLKARKIGSAWRIARSALDEFLRG